MWLGLLNFLDDHPAVELGVMNYSKVSWRVHSRNEGIGERMSLVTKHLLWVDKDQA